MPTLGDPIDGEDELKVPPNSRLRDLPEEEVKMMRSDPDKAKLDLSSARQIALQSREIQAVELRKAGWDYHEIAKALDFPNQNAAQQSVREAMKKWGADAVDDLRLLELMRLDTLTRKIWPKVLGKDARYDADGNLIASAIEPDEDSIDLYLRISARRAKILGLDAPKEINFRSDQDAPPGTEKVEQLEEMLGILEQLKQRELAVEAEVIEAEVMDAEPSRQANG